MKVTGKVYDQRGATLAKVGVALMQGNSTIAEMVSDDGGEFEYSTETEYAGSPLYLAVHHAGYEPLKRDIPSAGETDIELKLTPKPTQPAPPPIPPRPWLRWVLVAAAILVLLTIVMAVLKPDPPPAQPSSTTVPTTAPGATASLQLTMVPPDVSRNATRVRLTVINTGTAPSGPYGVHLQLLPANRGPRDVFDARVPEGRLERPELRGRPKIDVSPRPATRPVGREAKEQREQSAEREGLQPGASATLRLELKARDGEYIARATLVRVARSAAADQFQSQPVDSPKLVFGR